MPTSGLHSSMEIFMTYRIRRLMLIKCHALELSQNVIHYALDLWTQC